MLDAAALPAMEGSVRQEPTVPDLRVRPGPMWSDRIARGLYLLAGLMAFAVLAFILWTLTERTVQFFGYVPLTEFFGSTHWYAVEGPDAAWGVWSLVYGSLVITGGAVFIGLPLGLGTAIYLAEYASPRVRSIVKPALELLAGIPSIVLGFFALFVISPWLRDATREGTWLGELCGHANLFSIASAAIVVGIMVIPIIATLSEDAIRAVPRHLREASYGMGATKWETTRSVVIPAALSGITAGVVLGASRAIGESMAVAMAAGNTPNWGATACEPAQTMTGFIVIRSLGDVQAHGPEYLSLFAVGMTLFAMTWGLNVVANRFVRKYREVDL
jgi:phosphate transport system permease protein